MPLRIIHLEDSPQDAELVGAMLAKKWPEARVEVYSRREDFEAALARQTPDLILSDFSLPAFDGISALKMAHARRPATPFIFLSGTIGEEKAVEALRNGATDYVLKDRMGRLVPAIERALSKSDEQAKLRQAEHRIREQAALLDKARDAICVADARHLISYWNSSAADLFGWTAEEAHGRKFSELLGLAEPARYNEAVNQLQADGRWQGELNVTTKNGGARVIESRWTLVMNTADTPSSVLFINTDITERKKLEVQFLRSQRLESIGTLAGGVAHDLNNVLTPVIIAAQMLRGNVPDPESKQLADIIERSALHGASLLKQLLLFARGAEGERTLIQLWQLADEVGQLLRDTLPRAIQVRTLINKEVAPVRGDATQLKQVLLNLCINARDAMPDGGTITVEAVNVTPNEDFFRANPGARPCPYVLLSVTDTGTGIPAGCIERIFDPFFTTKELGKGTGLGLSTALGIIRSHSGVMQVASEEGKGTRFDIYLPSAASEATGNTAGGNAQLARGHGENVLVIDDEEYVREVVSAMLRYCGYTPSIAANGREGIEIYEARRDAIDLVIVDMMMPELDGIATMRRLREINPHVRLLAMSGMLDGEQMAEFKELKDVAFLAKPAKAERLLNKIREVLGVTV